MIKIPENIHRQKNYLAKLPSGGDALFVANLAKQRAKPILYIVNDGYQLQRLASELGYFAQGLTIATFSDYEVLAYERQSPYKELIADRLRTLWHMQHGKIDILLVQATTLQMLLPPPEYFLQRGLILSCGDKLDLSQLRRQLTNAGYQAVAHVYEAGEFAIRGETIDLLPITSRNALRIVLFDDEIESIAYFDTKKQQIINKVDKVEILPSREYPSDSASIKQLMHKMVEYFNLKSDSDLVRDFQNNLLPAGSEFYLPLFYDTCANLFTYLASECEIVYSSDLITQLNLNWQEIVKRYDYYNYQYPCLKPMDLFLPSDQIFAQLKKYCCWEIAQQGNLYSQFNYLPSLSSNTKETFQTLANLAINNRVIITLNSLGRIELLRQNLLKEQIQVQLITSDCLIDNLEQGLYLVQAELYQGFNYNNYYFVAETDFMNTPPIRRTKKSIHNYDSSKHNDLTIHDLAEIKVGDYVVHINYGIGRYLGLSSQVIADVQYDMLELEYQQGSHLYIPIQNLHLISRYTALEGSSIELNKLGSKQWDKIKTKTEQRVNDIAADLLELYAKREMQQGNLLILPSEYSDFAHSFGYEPTQDQQNCFDQIIHDLTSSKPMERLICGDVGFGKTEVAMRGAFISAMNGYQVAILAPTTLLVEQLYQNFVNRFAGVALNIAEISRFKTRKEITQTLQLLANGQLDIIIGTHRLLQDDIKFKNLGLVIIDEEHRFGVKQKEKLKQLRHGVDILTMTATPIPRTLSMALDGLRDFSIIATPPSRRLAVNTQICIIDDQIIQEAILREIRRGGQVFFLYNDVATIEQMADELIKLLPELRIAIAHGQMPENNLEQTIKDFIHQRYNLLLCSTIIETGIDIANANTILIYRADKFGLAQLHQLRGRVGRSHHQAYCYLLVPEYLKGDAEKRLEAIMATRELGAGFNLAMHDLEIRGAGEILGNNQAGNIKEVGLSLYAEMLRKAVRRLKQDTNLDDNLVTELSCEVNLNITTILPANYCPSVQDRLIYYKRLAQSENELQINLIYQEIIDQYGLPPIEVNSLIMLHRLRLQAIRLGIIKIDVTQNNIKLFFMDNPPLEPLKIVLTLQQLKTCRYDGENKLIWQINSANASEKLANLEYILTILAS
ncbi:MAG: transcription-repair coupling factor [Pseudomonadota bacterium]|jgi:transcription-repair coupling factor (superfamily II helicase)